MYIDYELRMSTNQALTVATSSTSYIDCISAGWGVDDEVYAKFLVGTAFTYTVAASITIAIQIAQDTAFGTLLTVVSQAILLTTSSTVIPNFNAKQPILAIKLPVAMMILQMAGDTLYSPNTLPYRYVRAYYTPTTAITGGIYCDLVKDVQTTIDRVR